ncbi:MAG: BtaA family protein [Simkaniaceae bacterium]|nr:BtaA family protein [Simkaniaceae bacterium]
MTLFYSKLSYSFGNEDWITEKKALQIEPNHTVVCVTASGDRPLNLLLNDCHRIISVDANPIQTHLLDLKCNAMKHLDFYSFLEFLGITNNQKKKTLPRKIYENLNEESKTFWVQHMNLIEKGIIYQGQVEKVCQYLAIFIRCFRGFSISKLTSFDSLDEQREFVAKNWDRPFWRRIFQIALNPKYSKFYIDDPGLTHFIGPNINPGDYIYDRMHKSLNQFLAKENPLFSLVLNGYVQEAAFAPHMKIEYAPLIKSRLDRLSYKTENMIDFLEKQPPESIDRFSFSDIASYMSEKDFNRMLRAMIHCAKPKARFCIRQFLSDHQIDKDIQGHLHREPTLEKELDEEDKCFLYRFMTGAIT